MYKSKKYVHNLQAENYKTLMWVLRVDQRNGQSVFMDQKTQYCLDIKFYYIDLEKQHYFDKNLRNIICRYRQTNLNF